ncbi:MAG: hypothetical protein AAGF95_21340 [Chloroflexota bacterium]
MKIWKKIVSVAAVTAALVGVGFVSATPASAQTPGFATINCPSTIFRTDFDPGNRFTCQFTLSNVENVQVVAASVDGGAIIVSPPVIAEIPFLGTIGTVALFGVNNGTANICVQGTNLAPVCTPVTVQ